MQSHREIFEKYLIYRMQIMVSVHQDENEKSGFYLPASEIIKLGREQYVDLCMHGITRNNNVEMK